MAEVEMAYRKIKMVKFEVRALKSTFIRHFEFSENAEYIYRK